MSTRVGARVQFARRARNIRRYYNRSSGTVAANSATIAAVNTFTDSGTMMGCRLCLGFTADSVGARKSEAWLYIVRAGAFHTIDPTTDADDGRNRDLVGMWACHFQGTLTQFVLNENIRARRKVAAGDAIRLVVKGPAGFDQESQLLCWVAE